MKIVAVYPGRFHPFHKGHAASFKQLAQKFGLENTLLAISAKQEQPKSPFSAQDRAKMAQSLGIPAKNILIVRNPYNATEYAQHLQAKGIDPTKTALVFGVSDKDMQDDPRFSFAPTKDGKPSYMQPFTKQATLNLQPMTKGNPGTGHAYVMTTAVQDFPIAGKSMRDASAIRAAYAGKDNKTKMRILTDLYGDGAENMKQTFDNNLQVTESIRRFVNAIKPMLGEATIEQKARFVELLSEAKKKLNEDMQKPIELVSDDDFEKFYSHPEFHKAAAYARQHYPSAPTKQQAFLRFIQRSLMHSEEDDKRQNREIELLMKRVNALQDKVDGKKVTPLKPEKPVSLTPNTQSNSEKIEESTDYLEEK